MQYGRGPLEEGEGARQARRCGAAAGAGGALTLSRCLFPFEFSPSFRSQPGRSCPACFSTCQARQVSRRANHGEYSPKLLRKAPTDLQQRLRVQPVARHAEEGVRLAVSAGAPTASDAVYVILWPPTPQHTLC
jgi:hypothetical protein